MSATPLASAATGHGAASGRDNPARLSRSLQRRRMRLRKMAENLENFHEKFKFLQKALKIISFTLCCCGHRGRVTWNLLRGNLIGSMISRQDFGFIFSIVVFFYNNMISRQDFGFIFSIVVFFTTTITTYTTYNNLYIIFANSKSELWFAILSEFCSVWSWTSRAVMERFEPRAS